MNFKTALSGVMSISPHSGDDGQFATQLQESEIADSPIWKAGLKDICQKTEPQFTDPPEEENGESFQGEF